MLQDRPFNVVIVCHANVARSVAAACLLADATDERGIRLALRSAGTHATEGQPASLRTAAALMKVTGTGHSIGSHRAHQLAESDVMWADLVIAMEDSQVRFLRRLYADAARHVATLSVLASQLPADGRRLAERVDSLDLDRIEGSGDGDVEDPAGGDDDDYERVMEVLVARCAELAHRLSG